MADHRMYIVPTVACNRDSAQVCEGLCCVIEGMVLICLFNFKIDLLLFDSLLLWNQHLR